MSIICKKKIKTFERFKSLHFLRILTILTFHSAGFLDNQTPTTFYKTIHFIAFSLHCLDGST